MTVSYTDLGDGPAVVFLHGVGSAKEGWRQQIETIVNAGFRFLAIDAPGFGETPLPEKPGFAPHVGAVIECLDQLNIEKAFICGHSLGGMTAQEIYAAHPDRVMGLILSATSPAFGRADGGFQKQFIAERMKPFDDGLTMPQFATAFAPRLLGSNASEDAVNELVEVMSQVSIEAYKLAMLTITGFDQRANLPNIDVPTLLISGDEDRNSPAPMMAKMASKIAGSDYVELLQTGHMAPVENSATFNQHLSEFLRKHV